MERKYSWKRTKEIIEFLTVANTLVRKMSENFTEVDENSPLFYWLMHVERNKTNHIDGINDDDFSELKFYSTKTKVSLAHRVKSSEWTYIEDYSLENFILGLFSKDLYRIREINRIKHIKKQKILVPTELTFFVSSKKFRDSDWIY